MTALVSHQPSAGPSRLPLLDGLRGIAALGVLTYHLPDLTGIPNFGSRNYLFVDLFFIMSGFVLALSAEPRMASGESAATFVKRRIWRLWPMIALGALLGALAFAGRAPAGEIAGLLVLALLMVPLTTSTVAIYPLNTPQWSLLWEIVANVLHALVLWRCGSRVLLAISAASALGLSAVILETGWNGAGPNGGYWWAGFLRVSFAYPLGIVMARAWRNEANRHAIDWRLALALPVIALLGVSWTPFAMVYEDIALTLFILPACFWLVACSQPPRAAVPALTWLGDMSYPVYAVHAPIMLWFNAGIGGRTAQVLTLIVTLIAARIILAHGPRTRVLVHTAWTALAARRSALAVKA